MSLYETVRAAMVEVGAGLEIPAIDEYASERMWHIATNPQTQIYAELDETRSVVVFSVLLGTPSSQESDLPRTVLSLNHAWDLNAGMRLTLDPDTETYWLLVELGAADLSAARLEAVLLDLTERGQQWRHSLLHPDEEDDRSLSQQDDVLRA